MHNTAVYPGSFDPITYGHLDLIERASKKFSKVIVSVVNNSNKSTLFTLEERVLMLEEMLLPKFKNIEIFSFDGLLVDFVKKHNSNIIIRGLRAVSDFEYEMQLALTNRKISHDVETIFLMPKEEYTYLSSSLVREVAKYGGDVSQFVHPVVEKKLKEKFLKK